MKQRIHLKLIVLLLVAGSLTACVRQRQYRYFDLSIPGRLPAIEDHIDKGYKLAFIEFKDNGDPHDRQQAIKAEELIRSERRVTTDQWASSSVVLIYIHGWKNNANQSLTKKKDVEKFKDTLEELAPQLPPLPNGRPTPLVGVYIGWHGKSLELPSALSWVSFWTRGLAAKHVGGDDLTKTLNKLVAAAKDRSGDRSINPKVVIVGHSFGSRVLEQAENRRSIQKGDCKQLHVIGDPIKQQVDLILFVNAATGSKITRDIIEECTPKEGTDPNHVFPRHPEYDERLCQIEGPGAPSPICRPYPLFVAISSRSDYATKVLLPFAAFRLSAAHTGTLNTHRIIKLDPEQEIPEGNLFTFRSEFHDGTHLYAVMPKDARRINPFWIMTVDNKVIADHGDIWNKDFRNMLLHLMGEMQVVQMPAFQRPPSRAKASVIR